MIDRKQINRLNGATVLDPDGNKVGTVGQAFVDAADGQPRWVTVRTGLFGRRESFVPVEQAELQGEVLHIPYGKATVKDAPHMDPSHALSSVDESGLNSYYNVSVAGAEGLRKHETADDQDGAAEPTADEELPEERPQVATATRPADSRRLLAETVMEFPEDDNQIRRSQIDFDGEVGRDRV